MLQCFLDSPTVRLAESEYNRIRELSIPEIFGKGTFCFCIVLRVDIFAIVLQLAVPAKRVKTRDSKYSQEEGWPRTQLDSSDHHTIYPQKQVGPSVGKVLQS